MSTLRSMNNVNAAATATTDTKNSEAPAAPSGPPAPAPPTSLTASPPLARQGISLRLFHPGWYAAVMGTGIVSVSAYMNPGGIPALRPVADVVGLGMLLLAYVLAVALGIPYILRWLRHPEAARRDLAHPMSGAMYATFPAGLLVLAAATAAVGPAWLPSVLVLWLVGVLAVVGGVLGFAASLGFSYVLFVSDDIGREQANGGWFIPPVVNIIIPLVLAPLLPGADPDTARFLLTLSYAAWGVGFFLFLMVAALLYTRLVHHPLPAAPLAPSLWIGLGPIGVGSLALLRLAQAGSSVWGELAPAVQALSLMGAIAIWGFGLWWLGVAALLLRRYLRAGRLPYGLGWWAFTFPVGAYTVATLTLARAWNLGIVEGFGVLLFFLLLVFWAVVAFRTVAGVRTGEVWGR